MLLRRMLLVLLRVLLQRGLQKLLELLLLGVIDRIDLGFFGGVWPRRLVEKRPSGPLLGVLLVLLLPLLLLQLLLLLHAAVKFLLLVYHCNRRILDNVGINVQ